MSWTPREGQGQMYNMKHRSQTLSQPPPTTTTTLPHWAGSFLDSLSPFPFPFPSARSSLMGKGQRVLSRIGSLTATGATGGPDHNRSRSTHHRQIRERERGRKRGRKRERGTNQMVAELEAEEDEDEMVEDPEDLEEGTHEEDTDVAGDHHHHHRQGEESRGPHHHRHPCCSLSVSFPSFSFPLVFCTHLLPRPPPDTSPSTPPDPPPPPYPTLPLRQSLKRRGERREGEEERRGETKGRRDRPMRR